MRFLLSQKVTGVCAGMGIGAMVETMQNAGCIDWRGEP